MNWPTVRTSVLLFLATLLAMTGAAPAATSADSTSALRSVLDRTIPALMSKDGIPGMAIGVAIAGRTYVFNYGVASESPRASVNNDTLFEIGSVSKTFTATLASWAEVQHRLSLADTTAKYLPQFAGTPFGNVTLLSLGTHTPGGLPLQVPDGITSDGQLMQYLERWRPSCAMGTCRTYSNISIGMLGIITAKSAGEDFVSLMQGRLLPALGLSHTFIVLPPSELPHYAWGYTAEGKPIRLKAGTLEKETYGVRTTAGDMIDFLQENIDPTALPAPLREAVVQTHTGYFHAGPMTQDLIWEQYPYPVSLTSLQQGNSYHMIVDATRVRAIRPAQAPLANAWINKTGTTNGFGAYAAFVPSARLGIVLLANKNYPIPDRVDAAYKILEALASASR